MFVELLTVPVWVAHDLPGESGGYRLQLVIEVEDNFDEREIEGQVKSRLVQTVLTQQDSPSTQTQLEHGAQEGFGHDHRPPDVHFLVSLDYAVGLKSKKDCSLILLLP